MNNRGLQQPRNHQDDDERILPLINVVFLLLIFFMIAGSMQAQDPFELTPPESNAPQTVDETPLVIHLAADGRMALDDIPVAMDLLAGMLAARAADEPIETVWVKADGDTDALQLVELMEQLRDAGVKRMRLLTLRREA